MLTPIVFYGTPLALAWLGYFAFQWRQERRSLANQRESLEAGLTEPASLHPLIDPAICIGCGSCITACPEGEVIGLIDGRAELVNPTQCIGHGACKTACPMDAIALVFGTEKRGVDIPMVDADFQTNVPGLFIAGELGGMGLIRNAIEQGRQAMESIRQRSGSASGSPGSDLLDVFIVGGGPAGFSASLAALEHKLAAVTVEQDTLGGTVAHFPRGKLVMTAPATLPIWGKVKFGEVSKEKLLAFWQEVEAKTGVAISYQERVEAIESQGDGFEVRTTRQTYRTRNVLLAIGRRGTPRKLGVPGEELPKVVYRLIDPEQYRSQRVLVVGGGDSALEAAVSIAEEPGTEVALSYRGDSFGRAKPKNRKKVEAAAEAGRLRVLLSSNVQAIEPDSVTLRTGDREERLGNDAVIVCAGGILPTAFLKSIGITVETKYGTA